MFEYFKLDLPKDTYSLDDLRDEMVNNYRWTRRYLNSLCKAKSLHISKISKFSFVSIAIACEDGIVSTETVNGIVDGVKWKMRKNMLIEIRTGNAVKLISFNDVGRKYESPWFYLDNNKMPDENYRRINVCIENLRKYFLETIEKDEISSESVCARLEYSLLPFKLLSSSKVDKCMKKMGIKEYSKEKAGQHVVFVNNGLLEIESLYHLYRVLTEISVVEDNFFGNQRIDSGSFLNAIADALR